MRRRHRKKLDLSPKVVIIDKLSHEGRGIARIEGKTTFIEGALASETIEFRYTNTKKDFDEGEILRVINPSSLRVAPRCPHYSICGACSLQHMDEKEQINMKQMQLLDLFQRFSHTQPLKILAPLTQNPWNYRNKARLSVRYVEKKQMGMVGFRERRNPRYITDINQCDILNAKVSADIPALKLLINSMEDRYSIAQIEVAAGDEEIALIFRNLNTLSFNDEQRLKKFAENYKYILFLQPNGPKSIYCLYPDKDQSFLHYHLPGFNLTYAFHPTDFTQINSSLNREMIPLALNLLNLNKEDIVLDLFCGLGNFSLAIAKFCKQVIGFEGSDAMVKRAYYNAKLNHITNVDFFAANLDDVETVSRLVQQTCTKILIDPPRSGAFEIMKQIETLDPQLIVYVSCNPVTLARDSDILVNQKGYILQEAGVMDMFPHTAHVESIALFVKR